MAKNSLKPNLSRTAFWDVNLDKIDFQIDSLLVMNKVFNHGTWADILEVLRFYGIDRVRHEVVYGAYYKQTALSFLCLILDLHESDFTAYQNKQPRRPVWNY